MTCRSDPQELTGWPQFTVDDIGKVLILSTPWWSRLWWWIKARIFRIKCDPPGVYVITDVKNMTSCAIEPGYRCFKCGKYKPWSEGAADDLPFYCDDCWAEEHEVS